MNKFYITTPIYYLNDKPHIGHAYTTIAADILARYHRLIGDETWYLTGTDEHGTKIAQAAEAQKMEPQKYADKISAEYQKLWDQLNISHDDFIRTTEKRHELSVHKFFKILKDKGALYKDKYVGLYCSGCEKFLTETELVDGKCSDHNKEPEKIEEENYFFKLKDYVQKVKEMIEKDEIKVLPAKAKQEVLGLFKQGLEDFSVTREHVKWGIPFPGDEKQIIYVWVEALHNYISAIGYETGEHTKWWPAEVQLMAKDIIKFHAIFWPAILLAMGEKPPKTIFAHGFFTVNGQKMSKSLGNVIDPAIMATQYGTDATRYLLVSQFPFGEDGDIKEKLFVEQYNSHLANNLGNLLSRVTNIVAKNFQGNLGTIDIKKTGQQKIKESIEQGNKLFKQYLDNYQIDKFLGFVFGLGGETKQQSVLDLLNNYIEQTKLWELVKSDKDAATIVCYDVLESLRIVATWLWPVMPTTTDKIMTQLGLPTLEVQLGKAKSFDSLVAWGSKATGQKVTKGEGLFQRL